VRDTQRPYANFLGVRVEAATFADLEREVDAWLADKSHRSRHIACLNAYCITLAGRDPELREIYNAADLPGPDGMPFTLWIRWVLRQPCDRFYGPDVVLRLAAHAQARGYSFYLYGGHPEVTPAIAENLEAWFPRLRVVGHRSPPFRPLSAEEEQEVRDEIERLAPDIILVGLGTPKQDHWIDSHVDAVRGSVMVACGAAFDFLGGRVRQAPRVVQRSGFEWLWRLCSRDFFRLWRRYTIMNAEFLWHFGLQQLRIVPRPVTTGRRPL
jgi:N-acetylglucosaminyldiphosphoundecaprenol N-acetyl-beta-D-mannosaminyltransferase